jgi:hypothetical protein
MRALLLALSMLAPSLASAAGDVEVVSVKGEVSATAPRSDNAVAVAAGAKLVEGTRVRTGKGASAELRFPDGTVARIREASEVAVRLAGDADREPSGLVLFFGRAWSKVVRAAGGGTSFEVRSTNCVAGVRGTILEVGVADDGAARVVVEEGKVAVADDGDEGQVELEAGWSVEASEAGRLGSRQSAASGETWEGWFAARAAKLEKEGLAVAKGLEGRLLGRRAQVEKLLADQRRLKKKIAALEARRARGEEVEAALRETLARLERVTARLVSMRVRLQAASGLFERWGALARAGGIGDGEEVGRLAQGAARMAADFADMIEEGTDLSPEAMDELIEDMGSGKPRKKPAKGGVKGELF